MSKSEYSFVELTKASTPDAFLLRRTVGEDVSDNAYKIFMNNVVTANSDVERVSGAQHGFVVYDGEELVASLGISMPVGDKLIVQWLSNLITDPKHRGLGLLTSVLNRVLETQDPERTYIYFADAQEETSFRGLKSPGVQRWLLRSGLKVRFCDDDLNRTLDEEGSARVMLYPATITIEDEDEKNNP